MASAAAFRSREAQEALGPKCPSSRNRLAFATRASPEWKSRWRNANYPLFLLLVMFVASCADAQDSAQHPVHNFFFFNGPGDFNRNIFYKHKLEFSLEGGWEPINIPFVYNFVTGSTYTTWPLHYTLEPNIASLRWTVDKIDWPGILRGSTDYTFSGSYVDIPRGPETRYFVFLYGIRRNFIRPNWRMVPYFDAHGGVGNINAKGPDGVLYAQGQDLTFTLMNGGGIRYDFNPRFSVDAGASYQHISNFYLSQPKYYDYGINVWGSMVGFNIRIGKARPLVQ